jgi:hypothetical protein
MDHPFRYLTAITVALIVTSILLYLMKPLPAPRIAIEFQGFTPAKTKVFHMKLNTNYTSEVQFSSVTDNDNWFYSSASSTNYPTEQTNAYCIFYITNHGPTRIWCRSEYWEVEARTPQGWVTNTIAYNTTSPESVGPAKAEILDKFVPIDAIEWRVTGSYFYYPRHTPCFEFQGWLADDLHKTRVNSCKAFQYMVLPVICLLAIDRPPEEKQVYFHTPYFTNRPPAVATP